jgi:hypothetical protein
MPCISYTKNQAFLVVRRVNLGLGLGLSDIDVTLSLKEKLLEEQWGLSFKASMGPW